jgi:MFS family permease
MTRGTHKSRDLRLIVGAVGASALGDFLLWIPLTLHLEATTGSGFAVAAMFIALWMPAVLLAPLAGLIVDRSEARRVLIWASLAQALVAIGLAFALDSLAAILVLAAALGIGNAISQPAEFALVPVIAGRDTSELNRVNGWVESARYAGMTVGPLVGGVLAATGGTQAALLIDAASFGFVALAGLALSARRPATLAGRGVDRARARDGIDALFRDRTLGIVIGVAFVSLLFMSAVITAEVFFLRDDLGVDGVLYGLLFSCWMVGMVIGGLALSRRIPTRRMAAAALVMIAAQGFGVGAPAAIAVVGFAGAMWLFGGVAHGAKNVLIRTLIQARVPEGAHGRAFAAYNGVRNGAELVALAAGGALVAALGGRTTLALAGGLSAAVGLLGLALYSRRSTVRSSSSAGAESLRDTAPAGAALAE